MCERVIRSLLSCASLYPSLLQVCHLLGKEGAELRVFLVVVLLFTLFELVEEIHGWH